MSRIQIPVLRDEPDTRLDALRSELHAERQLHQRTMFELEVAQGCNRDLAAQVTDLALRLGELHQRALDAAIANSRALAGTAAASETFDDDDTRVVDPEDLNSKGTP